MKEKQDVILEPPTLLGDDTVGTNEDSVPMGDDTVGANEDSVPTGDDVQE